MVKLDGVWASWADLVAFIMFLVSSLACLSGCMLSFCSICSGSHHCRHSYCTSGRFGKTVESLASNTFLVAKEKSKCMEPVDCNPLKMLRLRTVRSG